MKIAFLTPEYPHPATGQSGGLGTSIKNLANSLVKKGHKVYVIIYDQKINTEFVEDGINFHIIKQKKYPVFGWYLYRKYLQFHLNKLIKTNLIQLVEAPDWTGITAFMNLQCPLVIRMHGTDAYFCKLEDRSQKKKNYWFERIALRGADHLISVSEFTAQKTLDIFNLKRNVEVIPNAVDVEVFKQGDMDIHNNTILYFGSLIRKKGVLELAHIFNLIVKEREDVRLLLVGKDVLDVFENKSTLELFKELLSNEAAKNVDFLAAVKYEEIGSIIESAKVVLLPSFAEALPMTWLEAMAMQKAIVTSNIGWAQEIMIDGETGFMVNPKDHELFSKKVLILLNDSNLNKKMGRTARNQVIEKFSFEVVTGKNMNFYQNVIGNK